MYSSPQISKKFPTFQLSNFLVTWLNKSIWLSGYLAIWLSSYLAIWLDSFIWLAGSTCCAHSISTCCDSIHLLLILFPPVAPALSTCCSSFFHLLIPLNPLVASLPPLFLSHIIRSFSSLTIAAPTQYSLNYINIHKIGQYLYSVVLG